jgi:GntR family transcriptional regulator
MDDVPILIASARLPVSLAPGLEDVDFSTTSLYDVLEDRYGLRPARAHFTIEAIAAGERESELLSLEPGQPLLRCHQLTEDETGRMIEICEMRYRGDRYRFRATLLRTGSAESEGAEALAPNLAGSTTDG